MTEKLILGSNPKNDRSIIFSRHLDEIDDLESFERDAPLRDSPENTLLLKKTADLLIKKIKENGRRSVFFIVSPRVRAIHTAEALKDALINNLPTDIKLKFRISINEDLRASEQGQFILPYGYKAGEVFEGLALASKIFENENRGRNESGVKNLDYRFGDPVLISPGNYKYPELQKYFTEYGETYRETITRMFQSILDMSKKYGNLLRSVEVVVIGHGQTYHIIRGLNIIGQRIINDRLVLHEGEVISLLWAIYDACPKEEKIPGTSGPVDFSFLGDNDMMKILEDEIDYWQLKK